MKLNVNGQIHDIDADPDTPLLYVLRGELGLNAAKYGCGLGQCGACTVLVNDQAVFSCVTPVVALEAKPRRSPCDGRHQARSGHLEVARLVEGA